MFRSASRSVLRGPAATQQLRFAQSRRFISSTPAQKSRSWRSTVVRWGLAIGAVYYYNTSPVFAEDPLTVQPGNNGQQDSSASLPTLESVAAAKSRKPSSPKPTPQPPKQPEQSTDSSLAEAADVEVAPSGAQPLELSPEELENEAGQQGAFNPETGEINWDCPCLGGMAHGPCGEEFREAFSCFVYSEEEPKGMDCIEKFGGMQDCFRLHPEIYGGNLDEDDVDEQLEEHIEGAQSGEGAVEPAADREQTLQEVNEELDPKSGGIRAPEQWHDTTDKSEEATQEEKK